MELPIPVNEPLFRGREKEYLNECIDSGWISFEGPFVKRFESEFAGLHGVEHGISVSNGTAALELAFAALDLKPGDEVIMPSFTIISWREGCPACRSNPGSGGCGSSELEHGRGRRYNAR